jgi:periplasmic divalent cation tolerance protein
MSASMIYITAASREQAIGIGRTLVEERLAACANVLDGMTSVYRWEGSTQVAGEAVLLLKTQTSMVDRVTSRVRQLHTYEVPCVVSWPLEQGNPGYFAWIHAETVAIGGDQSAPDSPTRG